MKKLMMVLVLLPLMAVGFTAMASTINVSGGGDALQKAIDSAKAGDVLLVGPGAYSAIDTQGKEIEIRSTKGPKQTFLKTGSFSKSFGVTWGIGRTVKFAAMLVSDADTEIWSDDEDGAYPTATQWQDWNIMQFSHSSLVGFTIQGSAINGNDCFTVNGGRIVNCILTDASIHAAEAEGCLFVCPTRNDGELVCDSRLMNCTVVVGGASRCGEEIYCSELINTIVYALNGEVDIAWSSIIQPRMLNSVCYNIKRFSAEGHPMDLSGIRETDPLFVDRTPGDYRLTAASPCVDKGTNELSRADADLNGGARIVNGTVDIGAYEFGSEYSWVENQDGSVTITGIRGEVPDVLTLPSQLGGKPVSVIGPGVLAGDEEDGVVPSIKTLIVPEGVRRIGEDSFSRCPYLAKIVLPKSLEEIGEGAFTAGADSLPFNDYKWKDYENFGIREIQVADGNKSFEVKDGVLVDRKNGVAVVCCVNATSVSLPEGVREIGEHCFAYCQSLSAIWFPSSLQAIGKEAFLFCRQLKTLDFSNTSLSEVGKNAFGGCVNLQGVKFSAALQSVGKNAFYWCNALKSVTYKGNAPASANEIYITSNDDLATPRLLPDAQRKEMLLSQVVSYVPSDSTGWGEIPGVWQGCPVRHEPRMDLEHNYAFETGTWNGWTYAGMEDYRSQDYSGEEDNPWVFHFGNDQPQNIAIPVCECGTDRIRPVIVLGTASESDKLTASVLTEQEMANKFGIGKYRFERDDDEWEYEDERSKMNVFFPDSAWPELKLVADRQWVVISLSNVDLGKDGFFSPKTFYVGIYGTDQVTPMITIVPNDALPPTTGFTPKNVFGVEVVLKGVDSDSECHFNPDFELWASGVEVEGHVPYEFDTDEENDDDEYGYLNVTAPAKGALYVKFESDWYLEDIQTGRLKFSGSVLDGGVSVVKKDGKWWGDGEVWGVLKTKSAGTVKISGYGEKLYIGGIWFKPDLVDLDGCLGTSALYQETVDLANDRHRVCYRCYVTGMGVAKFGDKATLVCHPNEGEVLDHWEFVNCEAPADATVTSPTLTFTATKNLYDQIEGVEGVPRCVAVRPVLKKRHQIVVIPMPCGAATVDGNGYYFEGDEATVSLAAAEGCRFRSWSDEDESPSTRVFTADEDKVVYAYFDGIPVFRLQSLNLIPGEQSSFDTGFVGYTASGLPSGLKYNKSSGLITGAATKPTAAEGVVVTFRKTGEPNETLTVVVGPIPTVDVKMEGVNSDSDIQGCKVTGAKAYLVGAKVTLKATAPKGTAFVGWFDGETFVATQSSYTFTMGKDDVVLVAKFEKEVISVDTGTLVAGATFPVGVLGAADGIRIGADAPSGVKSIAVSKLPAGMKFDAKNGNVITGAPTKPGDYTVQVKVTSNSGAVETREIKISVQAMPETAVGTFSGFVANGESRIGTLTLTATDAGKLTAKVLTAAGTVSFSGTCWDSVEDGVYHVTLATKKGDFLTLALDTKAGWDANQLTGTFSPPNMTGWFDVSAQRNAFAQKWYFNATGNANDGWSLSFAQNAKAAALTVTLKADGSTAIAGKLPNGVDAKGRDASIKVSASGSANVGRMREGAILAGFAPVVTIDGMKKVLSIRANLWFDRSDGHDEGAGGAELVE